MFDEPDEVGGSDGSPRLYPKELVGHLLVVWAIDYIEHSPTKFTQAGKQADVIVVDVVDLDQVDPETRQQGLVSRRSWWRGGRLIGSLKKKVGSNTPLLARMSLGVATMGNPPYELNSMTSDQHSVARANAWFQANPGFQPSQRRAEWSEYTETPDVAADASFTPTPGGAQLKYGPPAGHHESLRQETSLEAMARRAMPPPAPPHHGRADEIPY
jgi:hypothetical protein